MNSHVYRVCAEDYDPNSSNWFHGYKFYSGAASTYNSDNIGGLGNKWLTNVSSVYGEKMNVYYSGSLSATEVCKQSCQDLVENIFVAKGVTGYK